MRRAVTTVLLSAGLGSAAPAHADVASFRAMTWNVRGSPSARARVAPFSLEAVRAVIERSSPDVLALQEVCSWQASALAASLGYSWHEAAIAGFADPRSGAGGRCDYGDALLSRTPIAAAGRYRTDLLAPPEGCQLDAAEGTGHPECRVHLGAMLTPGDAGRAGVGALRVTCAHVGTAREPYLPGFDQSLQLDRLVGDAEHNEPVALMMGDYNVRPDDRRLAPRMEQLGYREAGAGEFTFPSGGVFGEPTAKVDYVYSRGLVALRHQVVEPLVDGVEASDHRAVVADFAVAADEDA